MSGRKRKCKCCNDKFIPSPYAKHRQAFCSKEECQAESHRVSSKRSRDKIKKYFKKAYQIIQENSVMRVQTWRKRTPGYWKRKKVGINLKNSDALRDLALRVNTLSKSALRDLVLAQLAIIKALTVCLKFALRDSIGSLENLFYNKAEDHLLNKVKSELIETNKEMISNEIIRDVLSELLSESA